MKKIALFGLIVAMVAGVFLARVPILPTYGGITPMQPGSTVWGIQRALSGASGTTRLLKGDMLVLFWSTETGGTAFVGIDIKNMRSILDTVMTIGGKGNLINQQTLNTFRDNLVNDGWKYVTATEVMGKIGMSLAEFLGQYSAMMNSLPNFIIMPIILITPESKS
jgi:hypothetical protein